MLTHQLIALAVMIGILNVVMLGQPLKTAQAVASEQRDLTTKG